jgi:hypothetical protein
VIGWGRDKQQNTEELKNAETKKNEETEREETCQIYKEGSSLLIAD